MTNTQIIERIEALAIPPAWEEVKISKNPSQKILAQGIDAAGRTQILYHPRFRQKQDRKKFLHNMQFGEHLPLLRERVLEDLQKPGLQKCRIVAGMILLVDEKNLRVGNVKYAKLYGSFGITTLRKRHLTIEGTKIVLDFLGKSHQQHHIEVSNPFLLKLFTELKEIPGYEVFKYVDEDGKIHRIRGSAVNQYIKDTIGPQFSIKNFRTWTATVLAANIMRQNREKEQKKTQQEVVRQVSHALANTPAVAKSSYIDPKILSLLNKKNEHDFDGLFRRVRSRKNFSRDEAFTLELLRSLYS